MVTNPDSDTIVSVILFRIWNRRWSILVAGLIGGVLLVAASFLLTVRYKAQTRVIPASLVADGSGVPMSGSIMNLAQSAGLAMGPSGGDPSKLVPEIIKSEDFTSRLLGQRFAATGRDSVVLIDVLVEDEEAEHREARAHRSLAEQVLASTYDVNSGVTTISVLHADPLIAAGLANRVVTELDAFNLEMQTSQARYESVFISQRLGEVEADLAAAEETLRSFREQNRTIASSPQLLLESGRMERELALHQDLFITLKTQDELAKIQELKSVPTLRIMERARVPHRKHSPSRGLMGLAGVLLGAAVAMAWAVVRSAPLGS